MSHSQIVLVWNLGNPILEKVLNEVIQIGDENIDHVEHIVKYNLQVRYPALSKFTQNLVFTLNPLDQVTITRVNKQLQRPLTTNNILIANKMII